MNKNEIIAVACVNRRQRRLPTVCNGIIARLRIHRNSPSIVIDEVIGRGSVHCSADPTVINSLGIITDFDISLFADGIFKSERAVEQPIDNIIAAFESDVAKSRMRLNCIALLEAVNGIVAVANPELNDIVLGGRGERNDIIALTRLNGDVRAGVANRIGVVGADDQRV